ncbi:hypothetical protein A1O1_02050 [Capronia coronata CBS 617.96]|uniref:XRCC4 coiled-coil domain-containing protein n=1 Tax=Capronia coronata CBS 617.96 TaxID=1182541 RepID=W9YM66_9EURO|nr:uncharacterized protein A1O1_02050 [Capronia coronata CBS 617.96]EXJ93658.1 hypothetical protein A1O1_02050 [Capronia coronata CBS 617.96]
MAASSWVIRLEADKGNPPILVKVSRKEGGHDLDLDLLATDGDAAYKGKVRQRNLKKLRAKNYDGSDKDWIAVVSHVLLRTAAHQLDDAQKQNLHVTCSVSGKDPNGTLSIAFLNKVEDITQRLGNIELPQTEDTDDIDLFGWTLQAVKKRDELDEAVQALTWELKSKDAALKTLQKQIDELVEAKSEHEKQLLSKFSVLLNEKKLKIRNMQRVLSTAKTDATKLKELQSVIKKEGSASGGRGNKRRAEEAPKDDETDESEAFDTMQVDGNTNVRQHVPRDGDSPTSRETTPARSEDEDEDDDLGAPEPTAYRPRTRALGSKRAAKQKSPSPLPPPRKLPFQKKTGGQNDETSATQKEQKSKLTAPPADADEDETASEDDEL